MEEAENFEHLVDPLDVTNEMEYSNGDMIIPESVECNEQEIKVEQMQLAEEDDEETTCDVASFAQVTYANLDNVKSEENLTVELDQRNNENYCSLCHHTFTNKYDLFINLL